MTFLRQNIQNFNVLKPCWVAFGHLFPIKNDGAFVREGAFIRINMVCLIKGLCEKFIQQNTKIPNCSM